jgi:adenosylcobyric acid synthase
VRGSLLVAGTASGVGKTLLTAGICRWLARQGIRVAPFKAQNMSNNSTVTPGGAEIGRAQAMQAAAAQVTPEAIMNPVLLKPGSDRQSQLVVLGRAVGQADSLEYWEADKPDTAGARRAGRSRGQGARRAAGIARSGLLPVILGCYDELRSRFEVVICEGAGSPAEINLRAGDIVNMGLARARDLPVVVVGDIDRGGVFAALYGTVALLDAADQALICGFVINKFRGDPRLLAGGLEGISALARRPVLGVMPYLPGVWLDSEDTITMDGRECLPAAGHGEVLRVAVITLPRISNFTDVDALCLEPGVALRFATTPEGLADADLVILPGTKSTVADLGWLRSRGLDTVLARRATEGRPVLGICGGYQMLGESIDDTVESGIGQVAGLGLLPVRTRFAAAKTLGRPAGYALGAEVTGYEIHHGVVDVTAGDGWLTARPDGGAALDGCRVGAVFGTLWHGIMEGDAFRRAFLAEIARLAGRRFRPGPDVSFEAARQAQFETLADAVDEYLDTSLLVRLIEQGPPAGLPSLPPGRQGRPAPG